MRIYTGKTGSYLLRPRLIPTSVFFFGRLFIYSQVADPSAISNYVSPADPSQIYLKN